MNWCGGDTDFLVEPHESSLECDYDKNVTNLYDAIEKGSWESIMTFLSTNRWSFLSFTADVLTPESQTRTWVTRYDRNGKVRWSQLPLHAAIIFRAPVDVVRALIDLYPLSVQCTDDQRMLPLHLAVRVGAKDGILNLLIRCFPGALDAKNLLGRTPYQIQGRDVRRDYVETVYQIVKHTTKKVTASQQKWTQQKTDNLTGKVEEKDELVKNLRDDNDDLEHDLSKAKMEIAVLKERCRMLEKMNRAAEQQRAAEHKRSTEQQRAAGQQLAAERKLVAEHQRAAERQLATERKVAAEQQRAAEQQQRAARQQTLVDTMGSGTTASTSQQHSRRKQRKNPDSPPPNTILEQSKRILELVSSFTTNQDDADSISHNSSVAGESTVPYDEQRKIGRTGEVLANTLGGAKESAAGSVNLNPINKPKPKQKADVQWKETRQKLNNCDDIVSRFERRETDPVVAGREHYFPEADICWSELQKSVFNDEDVNDEDNFSEAITTKQGNGTRPSKSDFILRESAEKLLNILPKDTATRESVLNPMNVCFVSTDKETGDLPPIEKERSHSDRVSRILAPIERETSRLERKLQKFAPAEKARKKPARISARNFAPTEKETRKEAVKSRVPALTERERSNSVMSPRNLAPTEKEMRKEAVKLLGGANESVASSVSLNPIENPKPKMKADIQWKETRQKLSNCDDIVSRFERRETDPMICDYRALAESERSKPATKPRNFAQTEAERSKSAMKPRNPVLMEQQRSKSVVKPRNFTPTGRAMRKKAFKPRNAAPTERLSSKSALNLARAERETRIETAKHAPMQLETRQSPVRLKAIAPQIRERRKSAEKSFNNIRKQIESRETPVKVMNIVPNDRELKMRQNRSLSPKRQLANRHRWTNLTDTNLTLHKGKQDVEKRESPVKEIDAVPKDRELKMRQNRSLSPKRQLASRHRWTNLTDTNSTLQKGIQNTERKGPSVKEIDIVPNESEVATVKKGNNTPKKHLPTRNRWTNLTDKHSTLLKGVEEFNV